MKYDPHLKDYVPDDFDLKQHTNFRKQMDDFNRREMEKNLMELKEN
ncbi:hypothetical protein [Xenorhabdus griffiniae]|nr:hypothetical protein [Xenorhabdus griffiniae]MDC9607374.1 hypothetical protein [Xenorhabdus griffiniae]